MYWLLKDSQQAQIRSTVDRLVLQLSEIQGNPQIDQLFPYVGRKDRRKAFAVIKNLCPKKGLSVDCFVGSGSFVYAAYEAKRKCKGNEWEPYTCRMANAPWRLPKKPDLDDGLKEVLRRVRPKFNYLYRTICPCGHEHVMDSLFFDRDPLNYYTITPHERLGPNGENITYRGRFACPKCGRTEKHFDDSDKKHLEDISKMKVAPLFKFRLIENSRINLSGEFTQYGSLFPHRSKVGLAILWRAINTGECTEATKLFLQDAFLSILPQAKYKDYRSKSQDLHCPGQQLREVNVLYRFIEQVHKRFGGLKSFKSSRTVETPDMFPIECEDFREFLRKIDTDSVDLMITDPPWTDGNAYFEKAQLYHPWMGYDLKKDDERLSLEYVVTDAPSRRDHSVKRWWEDTEIFFQHCYRILRDFGYFALFFRPIPASKWLTNLNGLKLAARKAGFEPLLSVDVASSDPSMRIQQSAAYVFSTDVVMLFIKLPRKLTRVYHDDIDVDQLVYQVSEETQEKVKSPFTMKQWWEAFRDKAVEVEAANLNTSKHQPILLELFRRYCDEIKPGSFLPKANTPFSGQLFDIPAVERLFTYIPHVINELTKGGNKRFSYDRFLLSLSEFVENGTRMLIDQIEHLDLRKIIAKYAEPLQSGRFFKKRKLPKLPHVLRGILELDPYEFEAFAGHLLESMGFTSISLLGRAGDRGVDLTGFDQKGKVAVIQCKRYLEHKVSATPVQRLHSFAITRGAERRILITTSGFTRDAKDEARLTGTELIDRKQLEQLVSNHLPKYFPQA